jgi:two-component system sensor histidine kinase KdpD
MNNSLPELILPWFAPLVATLLAFALSPWIPVSNLALLYIAAVMITAANTRVRPALVTAILSFLAYNFFLTEPKYSLQMQYREDLLTALLLVMVALVVGQIAGRLNEKVSELRDSEAWNRQQMACASALSSCIEADEVIRVFATQLGDAFEWHVREIDHSDVPESVPAPPRDVSWTRDTGGIVLRFAGADGKDLSVLRMVASRPINSMVMDRIEVLVRIARLAWSRIQFADSLREERLDKEREQLRSALLSSVSHDLRTPLSTMIGSVSSLIDLAESIDEDQRRELLDNTLMEALRLDRYIQKLLDMTRLGHGELSLDRSWIGLDDIVGVVIKRARRLLPPCELHLDLPADLPLLYVHPALIEQAVFNVLENAVRFSPPEGIIRLIVRQDEKWLLMDVSDEGPGIRPENRELVFDMFHTFSHGDKYAAGTGLGLAICKCIVAAHGGLVDVVDVAAGSGATLRLSLPITEPQIPSEDE